MQVWQTNGRGCGARGIWRSARERGRAWIVTGGFEKGQCRSYGAFLYDGVGVAIDMALVMELGVYWFSAARAQDVIIRAAPLKN